MQQTVSFGLPRTIKRCERGVAGRSSEHRCEPLPFGPSQLPQNVHKSCEIRLIGRDLHRETAKVAGSSVVAPPLLYGLRGGVRQRLFEVRQWTATSLPVGGAIRQSMATLASP